MRLPWFVVMFVSVALGPAAASPLGDALAGSAGGWLLFAAVVAGLLLLGVLCRQASVYLDERVHASRVARLMDVLASQADGIVGLLLAHPPGQLATLQTVREAAIAQGIAYVRTNLPETLDAIGVTDGVLATRLGNEIAAKLQAVAPAPGGAVAPALSEAAAVMPQPAAPSI